MDARAFQRQQGWTQVMTTGLVLFNGVVIGLVVTGVFRLLVSIIDEALLW